MVCVAVLAGCADKPRPQAIGPTQPPGYVLPAIAAKAVDFRGTCSWGRAPGKSDRYQIRLRARTTPSGTVLVWASAFFDLTDNSNVLGELPAGNVAMGDGPVYDHQNRRKGYAILVRGYAGRVCRGYVTETSVQTE
ncbi:MAG: hypothetical protein MJE77_05545 [Proteobacteria bacterium]|nr:hypothetical protein [Pseudomonadota bacterium]